MSLLKLPEGWHQSPTIRLLPKWSRVVLFMALLQCLSLLAFSQTTATGRVVNESNSPVAGVTVHVKNSTAATTTDNAGNFTLRVPSGTGVLVFSYVGYTTQELPAGTNMSVQIQPANNTLGEVVVVGYGTQRRVSVSGAVDKISADALEGKPAVNVSQALQGTAPNLIIQQRNFEPGQGLNINIRGLGTLNDNNPLVVIDGIIGGDLNLINPNDIESVSVLKDAGSAAIYGSRSNNGVLLITTKKGRKIKSRH
jgi:TonB-dependent SusC/RagA subfamily outer membrane receptor